MASPAVSHGRMTASKNDPFGSPNAFDIAWEEERTPTDLEDLIPVRVARITEIFMRVASLAFTDKLGIRVTDLRIINVLHAHEEVSIADISKRARIDKAWISRLVRELEAKGLVSRRAHPSDARSSLVTLTPQGEELQTKLLPMSVRHEARALGGIDRAAFVQMLDLFERNGIALLKSVEQGRA